MAGLDNDLDKLDLKISIAPGYNKRIGYFRHELRDRLVRVCENLGSAGRSHSITIVVDAWIAMF